MAVYNWAHIFIRHMFSRDSEGRSGGGGCFSVRIVSCLLVLIPAFPGNRGGGSRCIGKGWLSAPSLCDSGKWGSLSSDLSLFGLCPSILGDGRGGGGSLSLIWNNHITWDTAEIIKRPDPAALEPFERAGEVAVAQSRCPAWRVWKDWVLGFPDLCANEPNSVSERQTDGDWKEQVWSRVCKLPFICMCVFTPAGGGFTPIRWGCQAHSGPYGHSSDHAESNVSLCVESERVSASAYYFWMSMN